MAIENSAVSIEIVGEFSSELSNALMKLVPQVSSGWVRTPDQIAALLDLDQLIIFIARLNGEIVGTLTMVVVETLTGRRGHDEDVVVDESARNNGLGGALLSAALEHSVTIGVRTVDLTSRPSREAANRLYERFGFKRRDTNVWRWQQSDTATESPK